MGRNRKDENKDLPKGVYSYLTKKGRKVRYKASIYMPETQKQVHLGPFDTWEEAEYMRKLWKYGNHWGLREDGFKAFGFIYRVTHRATGKEYIGKKQMFYWAGPPGGYKENDQDSPWYDPLAWKDGQWRQYTTSSEEINELIANGNVWDFEWKVIGLCDNVLELHKAEINWQESEDVLERLDEDGSYHYFNKNIAGLLFRPPFRRSDVLEAQLKTAEEARVYYLKPNLDPAGRVIPFGTPEVIAHVVDNGRGGDFDDLTK